MASPAPSRDRKPADAAWRRMRRELPPGCLAAPRRMDLGWAILVLTPCSLAQAAPDGNVKTLAPVIVSTPRTEQPAFDVPASIDVVEGADMRDRKLQVNLSEGLAGVPGLQIQNRQNYAQDMQISIRGFGARSTFGVRGVRLYVDGIPATLPDGQGQTSNIDIGSTDRVEILRGPFSALYGNSSGGVMQVYTQTGQEPPTLSGSFAAGSFGTYRYGLQATGANGSGPGALDYNLDTSRFTTDGYRDHSGARKNLGNAKLGLALDDASRLTLVLNSVDLHAQDPLGLTRAQYQDAPRAAPLADQFDTRKSVRQSQGGLLYERHVDADNELRLMVYYGQRNTSQFQSIPPAAQVNPLSAGGVIALQRDYGGVDARWTSRLQLAGRPFTLIGGFAYDTLQEQRQGYQNFTGSGATQQLGVQGQLRRDETNHAWNADPYVQASWQAAQRWTLEGGLRYSTVGFSSADHYIAGPNGDDSGDARYRKLLPVAALRYAATPDLNLYAAYGRGFETPTLNEISYRPDGLAGLNFNLQPATNTSVEAGVKARVLGGSLNAAVFQTNTDDEIVTDTNNNGRATFQNAGRTRRQGLELEWKGEFARNWRTQFTYALLDATYRDGFCSSPCAPGDSVAPGNRLPGVARQAAFASVGWVPPQGWRAGVEARYLSNIQVDDQNSDSAPAYFVTALSTGYVRRTGAWQVGAYARVDNIFDRKYAGSVIVNESNGRYFEPAPGRNWSAGVSAAYAF